VLASASSRSRTFPFISICSQQTTFKKRIFRRDAETSTRDACATRKFRYSQRLAANGFKIPRGRAPSNADEAVAAAKELGGEVVIKIQAWTSGRAGIGGVPFAKKPDDVRAHAARMLAMKSEISAATIRCSP
jgi:biotin carboxylase